VVEGDLDLYCLDDFKRAVAAAEDTEDSLIILDLTQWYVRASLSSLSFRLPVVLARMPVASTRWRRK
jgi:hypothetical protein